MFSTGKNVQNYSDTMQISSWDQRGEEMKDTMLIMWLITNILLGEHKEMPDIAKKELDTIFFLDYLLCVIILLLQFLSTQKRPQVSVGVVPTQLLIIHSLSSFVSQCILQVLYSSKFLSRALIKRIIIPTSFSPVHLGSCRNKLLCFKSNL